MYEQEIERHSCIPLCVRRIKAEGATVGGNDGLNVGGFEGAREGRTVGLREGLEDGAPLGLLEGTNEGTRLGEGVGGTSKYIV